MQRFLVILILLFSFLFSFGEQPMKENNLAYQAVIISAQGENAANAVDGLQSTSGKVGSLMLDLGANKYIEVIKIYQKNAPHRISLSTDIINWETITADILEDTSKEQVFVYKLDGEAGRYLKIENTEPQECSEIVVIPSADYHLGFEDIHTQEGVNTCNVYVKTTMQTTIQVSYALNYDFIYKKKFTNAETVVTGGKEHVVGLSGLTPETTYRYQVRVTDYNGKILESNYFTFTTLPDLNAEKQ